MLQPKNPHKAIKLDLTSYNIDPNDTENLPYSVFEIRAGTQGDIKVTTANDDVVIFKGVKNIQCHIKQVWENGTTALNLVGIYNKKAYLKGEGAVIEEFFLPDDIGNFVSDQDGNYILVE
jgi:hypothetical protein